jgi:general secretion pathway protein A
MYTSYFGLSEKPFAITPDPRYLYLSERHAEALAHLLYGINESGGFIQLTGEVGTGKTTVVRTLLSRIPHHADVAVILNPRITPVEFLLTICEELGVGVAAADRGSVKQMVDALNQRLLLAHAEGRRVIVIVDEAQNLSAEVLEQVRLLTNLETPSQKLLQIILIGQPELRELLDRTDLRQLAQRITGRYHLSPLSREETKGYVRHRLRVAGVTGEIFSPAALTEVHRLSSGIPRVINVCCDRALLGAYTRDMRKVSATLVRRAAGEVYGRRFAPAWIGWLAGGIAIAGVIGAVLAGWQLWSQRARPAQAAAAEHAAQGDDAEPVAATGSATANAGALLPTAAAARGPDAAPMSNTTPMPGASQLPNAAQLNGAAQVQSAAQVPSGAPNPSAVDGPMVPPAARAVPITTSINALLAANAGSTGDAEAYRRLFALWGTALVDDRDPCGQAIKSGLSCFDQRGSWAQVRMLNRPAILTLTDELGRRHRVVLTALDDRYATFVLGDHNERVPLEDVSRMWYGEFTVVWKPKTRRPRELSVGMSGEEVRWLRRSLNTLKGEATGLGHSDLYDQQLAVAVQNFQREHRMNADGIAGIQTQVVLEAALADPDSPLLLPQAPQGG